MKKWILSLGLCLIHVVSCNAEPLPEPYASIKVLPFDGHNFYYNGEQMANVFRAYQIKIAVEVGVWLGGSVRHIAQLLPEGGKVYAIDHWKGSIEHQAGKSHHHPAVSYLYQQFLSNVIHAGLTDKIIPVRMDSLEAAKALDIRPDLVYIDAAHDEESVYNDLVAWFPLVKGHGVLCGDDYRTVEPAVKRFAAENNLTIVYAGGSFWKYDENL